MLVVDLFCGCGGFSTGAKMAGHQVVLAIDSWDEALKAHKFNHPDTKHVQLNLGGNLNDCKALIMKSIPDGARWHLHGSPPCQNLSIANRSNGDEGEGMRLVHWYLNLVKMCKPTSWSMEQVLGAAKFLNDGDFEQFHLVNTADYLVPQTRKRLFLGAGWKLPKPLGHRSLANRLPYLRNEGNLIKGYKNTVAMKVNGAHIGNRKLKELEGFKTIEEPTYTLCASGALKLFNYDEQTMDKPEFVRDLNSREGLTIQGFPEWYKFPPGMAKTIECKLVGNAVAPPMSYLILKK